MTLTYLFPAESNSCVCLLAEIVSNSSSERGRKLLYCQRDNRNQVVGHQFPCHRYDKVVRIGPVTLANLTENESRDLDSGRDITIAPWAFSELFMESQTTTLQLDLRLTDAELNALNLGGLDTIQQILARNSLIRWDGCSFANMPRLEQVLLSCKSDYRGFLTFGPGIRLVRFVDCEHAPLQFYCVNCQQNPEFNVIRISTGPPLGQYMVKFSQFNENTTQVYDEENHLSVGKCVHGICSDEVLCRNNLPFQMVLDNVGRRKQPEKYVDRMPHDESDGTVMDVDSITTSPRTPSENPDKHPTLRASNVTILSQRPMTLSRRQNIWLTVAVLCLIVVFLIISWILIMITRNTDLRRRRKRIRSFRQRQNSRLNHHPPSSYMNGTNEQSRFEMQHKTLPAQHVEVAVSMALDHLTT